MKVVNCIPIDGSTGLETLTYFSQKDIPDFSIVAVPLRNKLIQAVVVSKSEVADIKATIRSNPYGLKKVARVVAPNFFSKAFMDAGAQTADYFASRAGAVLSALTPSKLPTLETAEYTPDQTSTKKSVKSIIQNAEHERFDQYKSTLRQYFSQGLSVTVLVPTITDGERLKSKIEKGIEKYCYFFHSGVGKRKLSADMALMLDLKHPVLTIVTGGFFSLMPKNTGLLIVEREASSAYKTPFRPFLDFRRFAESLADTMGIPIIFGDELVSLENHYRLSQGLHDSASRPRLRAETRAKTKMIDMRDYKPTFTGKYTILSRELLQALSETRADSSHSFLYVARKGLYPNTVCGDCGSMLYCKVCGASMVLHKIRDEIIYMCHRCGEKRDSHTRCDRCDSWKLVTLGIGSEKVVEELTAAFPKANIFKLDRDSAKNRKAAEKIVKEYQASPGSILVGTELAIPYLEPTLALGAIVSLDALFCVPEYRINEKIMSVLTRIRSVASKDFIVQTRHTDSPLIEMGLSGNLKAFYEHELSLRKKFGYPPFATFIKTTVKGNSEKITAEMRKLEHLIDPQKIHVFPGLASRQGGRFGLNGLIKLPAGVWPEKKTAEVLKGLPPNWSVNVEPESLL